MGPSHWEWEYRTGDDRDPRPMPPPEDPVDRERREKAGCGRSEWKLLQNREVTFDQYKRAQELDRQRAEKKGRK